MAVSPLTKTPTDVMYMVFDKLPIEDLSAFRLVCRWANDQSFRSFAKRGYRSVTIRDDHKFDDKFLKVVENNDVLRSAERTLIIRGKFTDYGVLCRDHYLVRKQPTQPEGEWKLMEVVASLSGLPSLSSLAIWGTYNPSLEWHLFRQYHSELEASSHRTAQPVPSLKNPGLPHLTALSLHKVWLTRQDFGAIFQLAGDALTHLAMHELTLVDGSWIAMLRSKRHMTANMTKMSLVNLYASDYINSDVKLATFRDSDVKFHKAIRGQHGIEAVSIQREGVNMMGAQAVRIGMDMILKHIGFEEAYAANGGKRGKPELTTEH
ncbi:hypothetical protein LTR27_009625 [Elasticomyces elasticus]|nr:hypothetical protein LTR27_009625 [Elasticomyces elasticus]